MAKAEKLLQRIRQNGKGVRFTDLKTLLLQHGFTLERVSGSHHIFRRADGRMCNVQAARDGMAKKYQVDQVLEAIDAAS